MGPNRKPIHQFTAEWHKEAIFLARTLQVLQPSTVDKNTYAYVTVESNNKVQHNNRAISLASILFSSSLFVHLCPPTSSLQIALGSEILYHYHADRKGRIYLGWLEVDLLRKHRWHRSRSHIDALRCYGIGHPSRASRCHVLWKLLSASESGSIGGDAWSWLASEAQTTQKILTLALAMHYRMAIQYSSLHTTTSTLCQYSVWWQNLLL